MRVFHITYKRFGEKALLIEWEKKVDESILNDIIDFKYKIGNSGLFDLNDLIVGYHSLTLVFKNEIDNHEGLISDLNKVRNGDSISENREKTLWKIPVCYESKFGIDLEEMAQSKNMSIDSIIKLHTDLVYVVFFIGFLPGFLYLGGLDKRLHTDRKANPRLKVAQGSIAIGGTQTGVYPMESPGGWNIIGRTPISFFDLSSENPCFAESGDRLKFYSVSEKEYNDILKEVDSRSYTLKKELL